MKLGIIPNTKKENIVHVVKMLLEKLDANGLDFSISDEMFSILKKPTGIFDKTEFQKREEIFKESDIIVSIGGDGTMLTAAIEARKTGTPLLGVNFGKLGFLAEFDVNNLDQLIKDLKEDNYYIEERMTLQAECLEDKSKNLFAINDIVIDKGGWPKMIEITMKVDEDYVSTFSADGIIIATPTGTTGYSLSTGGPIVNPKAKAITLSPISPHTLTMRPLVLSSDQKITISVNSQHTSVQVNCDGQRVNYYEPPATFEITKSAQTMKLVHTKSTNYFQILRSKLFWGLDIRNNPPSNGELDER